MGPEYLVGRNSQSSLPVDASNAWILRSLVPPLNTNPPAVTSIAPQFGDFSYLWVQTFSAVSTFHACTSPTWSAPGATEKPLFSVPMNRLPASYFTSTPREDEHRFSFAGM